jgi:ferredoxin
VATLITEECIRCGLCVSECPNTAISEGASVYEIDPGRCTECVGFHSTEQCAAACPVVCCLPDPYRSESEATLFERAKKLHPDRRESLVLGPTTSRFAVREMRTMPEKDRE